MKVRNVARCAEKPTLAGTINAWQIAKFLKKDPDLARWVSEKAKTPEGVDDLRTLIRIELKRMGQESLLL